MVSGKAGAYVRKTERPYRKFRELGEDALGRPLYIVAQVTSEEKADALRAARGRGYRQVAPYIRALIEIDLGVQEARARALTGETKDG